MFIADPDTPGDIERLSQATTSSMGFPMNLGRAWAWRPDIFEGFAALRTQLTGKSTLSKRDQAVMVCAMASQLGDSYCSLAWGKTLAQEAGAEVAAGVISDSAQSALTPRDKALAAWARKVVKDPNGTTAQDLQALRDAGLAEKEVFEATVFVAFRLAFSTVNDALGVQPDWQLAQAVPPEVAEAVNYGRAVAARP
jgi:uncharacterized peroxidase-related enzyme